MTDREHPASCWVCNSRKKVTTVQAEVSLNGWPFETVPLTLCQSHLKQYHAEPGATSQLDLMLSQ